MGVYLVKMSILPKVIYRFNAIPTKIPMMSSAKLETPILRGVSNFRETQTARTILKNKSKTSLFQNLPQSHNNQNSVILAYRQTIQAKGIEYRAQKRTLCGVHMWSNDFYKSTRATQWVKNSFWQMGARKTGYTHANEWSCLTPYTKINLKWIKNLNIKSKTIKFLT